MDVCNRFFLSTLLALANTAFATSDENYHDEAKGNVAADPQDQQSSAERFVSISYDHASKRKSSKDDTAQHEETDRQLVKYTKRLAIFTKWLAGVTAGMMLLGFFQLWFVMRGDKTARIAADAARKSAEAATQSVVANNLTVQTMADNAARELRAYVAIKSSAYDVTGNKWVVRFKVENVGKTPAFSIRISGYAVIREYPLKSPLPQLIFDANIKPESVLFPGQGISAASIGEDRPDPSKPNPLGGDAFALYLIAEIRYVDAFGKDQFTRSCMHSGNVLVGGKFDNFSGYREGNDAT